MPYQAADQISMFTLQYMKVSLWIKHSNFLALIDYFSRTVAVAQASVGAPWSASIKRGFLSELNNKIFQKDRYIPYCQTF